MLICCPERLKCRSMARKSSLCTDIAETLCLMAGGLLNGDVCAALVLSCLLANTNVPSEGVYTNCWSACGIRPCMVWDLAAAFTSLHQPIIELLITSEVP